MGEGMKKKAQKRRRVESLIQDESDTDIDIVERVNKNHVLFYSDVNTKSCAALRKIILDVELEQATGRALRSLRPLYIHIYSLGGDAYLGLALYDVVRSSQVHTIAVVEGICASAASLLFMACKQRMMTTNSFLLFHQLSVSSGGKCNEVAQQLSNMNKITEKFLSIYADHCTLAKSELQKEISTEKDMDASTALKYGFATALLTHNAEAA